MRGILDMKDGLRGEETIVDVAVLGNGFAFFVDGKLNHVGDLREDGLGILQAGGHAVCCGFGGKGADEVDGVLVGERLGESATVVGEAV
jgi:hypothetical protein